MNNPNYQTPIVETSGVNKFYAKVYGFFAVGLGISGIAAYLCATMFREQTINFINRFPLGFMGIWIFELILVVILGMKAMKNPALSIGGFIVYSLINGVTLSVTLMYYDINTVYQAFAAASATFIAAGLFGAFTKRDLSMIGRIGMIAVMGMILTTLINVFILRSSGLDLMMAYLSVLIFTGLTAYDNQMIRKYYERTKGTENSGIAAFVALQLYLDFINLLLSFLRIFSRNN